MRLVSVVMRTRSSRSARARTSAMRSSTWAPAGRTVIFGIHEPGGPDDLLGDGPTFPRPARPRPLPAGQAQLVGSRRGRDVQGLAHEHRELLERERPVVERRRQPESVLDERLLPRPVARVHPADLRDGDVRLVDDDDRVLREVVHQRRRILARLPPGQMARVVLDAVAVADLPQHLHVEQRPLLEPLGLEEPPARPEEAEPLPQLVGDARERLLELRPPASRSGWPGRSAPP